MYDNSTRILDFLFNAIIDEYMDRPKTPAETAARISQAELNTAIKKAERTAPSMGSSLTEIENAIGDYACTIEREALRYGLYTGFRAARELLTGVCA